MLRSARTAHLTDTHAITIPAAGFALASAALIAATACGTEIKEPRDVAVDTSGSSTVATAGTTGSSGSLPTPNVVVPKVSLSDGELAYKDKRYVEATQLFSTYADQNPNDPW